MLGGNALPCLALPGWRVSVLKARPGAPRDMTGDAVEFEPVGDQPVKLPAGSEPLADF